MGSFPKDTSGNLAGRRDGGSDFYLPISISQTWGAELLSDDDENGGIVTVMMATQ